MDWIDVAFSVGTSVTVSVGVTVYFFTWLRSDIKELKQDIRENRADVRDLKNIFLQYIAKDKAG